MTDNFLDELLQEAEQKEEQQTEAYHDLILLQIQSLANKMDINFKESEKEINLIREFTLSKNATLQERINFLEKKLEAFIREKGEKTISLPHGTLKLRKKPDKVEVSDMELFLKKATKELVSVVPESVKPDLKAIKAFITRTGKRVIPEGVNLIEGQPEFSYKLNEKEESDVGEQTETGFAA